MKRKLTFVSSPRDLIGALDNYEVSPVRTVCVLGNDYELLNSVAGRKGLELSGTPDSADVVLIPYDTAEVAPQLHELRNYRGMVVAPKGRGYWKRRPLFLISIPKAGTHLLRNLVAAFGYRPGERLTEAPLGGCWYTLEYANSHTRAPDFFVESVRRAPFALRDHPFPRTPTLFIYRNPLDILVSEASYYHQEFNTAFYGYLAHLPLESRIDRLIEDPWLLGSIRDRIAGYVAWLEFPNVIPLSFEELIGPLGGGDREIQEDLIWSVQLKLQVDGSPDEYVGRLFDTAAPTFRSGRIGEYREFLSESHLRRFFALKQDFMEAFGYRAGQSGRESPLPMRRREFRDRPIKLGTSEVLSIPRLIDADVMGANLVRFGGHVYAVPRSAGELDVRNITSIFRNLMIQGMDERRVRENLTSGRIGTLVRRTWQKLVGIALRPGKTNFAKLLARIVTLPSLVLCVLIDGLVARHGGKD